MSSKIINILVILVLIVLSLAIFTNSMAKDVIDIEHMHCTAGALLSQGKMVYKDFSYPGQMPYQPLLYAALFKVLNTTRYLLTARLFSAFCCILTAFCIVGIYRRVFTCFPIEGVLLGLAAAILYVFNYLVGYMSGFARNHDLVIVCFVMSYWLFISIDFHRKSKYRSVALIGVLLTLASCVWIAAVFVQVLFFVMLLVQTGASVKQKVKTALPFLISSMLVSLWPAWTIISAPRAFFLNLFSIPMYYVPSLKKTAAFYGRFELVLPELARVGVVVLVLMAAYFCITLVCNRRRLTITNPAHPLLAVLSALTFFIISLIVPLIHVRYLVMSIPFILISFAFALFYLRKLTDSKMSNKAFDFRMASIATIACAFAAIGCCPDMLLKIPNTFKPQIWVPVQVHKMSLDIARKSKSPQPIPTLAPIYALEAGRNIYTELSAGPFVYQVANIMSPDEIKATNTISPIKLQELLQDLSPSVVIVHAEGRNVEMVIIRIAKRNWPEQYYDKQIWERKAYNNDIAVYFRRDQHYTQ